MQSAWLMAIAVGNAIVIVVAKASFLSAAKEFLFFAGFMGVTLVFFIFLALRYEFVRLTTSSF